MNKLTMYKEQLAIALSVKRRKKAIFHSIYTTDKNNDRTQERWVARRNFYASRKV